MLVRFILSAALAAVVSCDAPAVGTASASPVTSAPPSRAATLNPTKLPSPDQERAIADALAAAGMRLGRSSPTKFDWLFGDAAPRSGTFTAAIDGTEAWADVFFLNGAVDGITACSGPSANGETAFTVSVRGRPQVLGNGNATGYLGSSGPMYFAVSERIFVMTPDGRLRDALASSLALSVPSCVWREPATLPAAPWERAVMEAFSNAGLEVRLIGGSKWESFLGELHEARHFTWTRGASSGAAEAIYLAEPLRELRMCSASSAPGFTKWTMVVNGAERPGAEGSQTLYPLVGPSFFVLAWDAETAGALGRGLGLNVPPC